MRTNTETADVELFKHMIEPPEENVKQGVCKAGECENCPLARIMEDGKQQCVMNMFIAAERLIALKEREE